MPMLLVLLMFGGGLYYFTTPEEKTRFVRRIRRNLQQFRDASEYVQPERGPFGEALRARTPLAIVTPALVAINVAIFLGMLFGAGALSDPNTLVGWGGSFGPRTTNGEWWRLVTALFVHTGPIHLIANIVGLVQIGLITERLFGRVAFATAYLAAGVLSSLVSLALHSVSVSAGASASIFGVYGLFLAALIAGNVFRSPLTVPLITALKLVPAAAVFILYSTTAGFDGVAEIAGFAVGCVYGLVLAQEVGARTPSPLRVACTTGVVLVVAIAVAVPLRGLTDVRPEIERLAAVEHQTVSSYDSAVRRFTGGEISMVGLSEVIDQSILPELRAARARFKNLQRVPREQQPLVLAANEYFRLREESWRVRADALRKINEATMQQAEDKERVSLLALEKIIPSEQQ